MTFIRNISVASLELLLNFFSFFSIKETVKLQEVRISSFFLKCAIWNCEALFLPCESMDFRRPLRNVMTAFSPDARPTEACELPEGGEKNKWRKWLSCIIQVIYHLAHPVDGDICLQLLVKSVHKKKSATWTLVIPNECPMRSIRRPPRTVFLRPVDNSIQMWGFFLCFFFSKLCRIK